MQTLPERKTNASGATTDANESGETVMTQAAPVDPATTSA
jgi:hypothetical protein